MNFNAPVFLFLFLPVCLLVYSIAETRYKNWFLLAASLVFFAWGQWFYIPLMLLVILFNFYLAQQIEQARGQAEKSRSLLVLSVSLNLAVLIFFKLLVSYGGAWLAPSLSGGPWEFLVKSPLPLGLSYIAFQMVSYQFDVSNELCDSEKKLLNFSLYTLLFPKIITGPIARYRDLAGELDSRKASSADIAGGLRRFIQGLAKKVLIADQIARIVNPAFALSSPDFGPGIAWLVVLGYTLQLYFDFSGYTDMAIGLGQVFGFHFPENFNYPYISRSIGEFWRRWHITLSSWFRDYVFYPLEFSGRRVRQPVLMRLRQPLNILGVFFLTGLWHGLTLNFAVWGLVHGAAIALETLGFGRRLKKAWAPLQHAYALAVIILGWVFFRSPSLSFAIQLLARMFGSRQGLTQLPIAQTMPLPFIENSVWLALVLGTLLCLPALPWLRQARERLAGRYPALSVPVRLGGDLFLLFLLLGSFTALAGNTFVSSIYGAF